MLAVLLRCGSFAALHAPVACLHSPALRLSLVLRTSNPRADAILEKCISRVPW